MGAGWDDGEAGRGSSAPLVGIEGLEDTVEIGRGGFAVVYRARQPALNRLVAVKVLSVSIDPSSRERFAREGFAIGTVSGHPNIVNVLGTGVTPAGRPYIAMPYLARGSLADRLDREGTLPWPEAVGIGVKLAGALETAHRADMLHRDVKPENVLLSDYGEPQLADFGIARVEGRFETSSGHILASISYAAPEVLDGRPATVASDVYSLAATLFSLLAGCPPFPQGHTEELVALYLRIATDPVPDLRPRGIPDAVCRALEAALAKKAADRPGGAGAFGGLLQDAERDAGLSSTEMAIGPRSAEASSLAPSPPRLGRTVLEVRPSTSPDDTRGAAARSPLVDEVRALLTSAAQVFAGTAAAERVEALVAQLDGPLRVAVAGKAGVGKSTLVDALDRTAFAPSDADDLSRAVTIVDTPDLGPLSWVALEGAWPIHPVQGHEEGVHAVLYLLRLLDQSDLKLLETFHRAQSGPDEPVNVVGVLARADELGFDALDPMAPARTLAARHRVDLELRRLCQTVVPVAARLALTGATLQPEEFRAVQILASQSPDEVESLPAQPDTFTETASPLSSGERRRLLERLGLAGTRLAIALVRQQVASDHTQLAAALVARSGLEELHHVIRSHFAAHSDVLKARSVLIATETLIRVASTADHPGLAVQVERIWAGAHELVELALLTACRQGMPGFAPGEGEEAERLLGASGTTPATRLGLPADASPAQLREAALERATHWHRRAEHPLVPGPVAAAARVLARSCEGILAQVPE